MRDYLTSKKREVSEYNLAYDHTMLALSCFCLEKGVVLDVFTPSREDFVG
nr:hypothetical protein [uncultured Sphaerochaeta sp.]